MPQEVLGTPWSGSRCHRDTPEWLKMSWSGSRCLGDTLRWLGTTWGQPGVAGGLVGTPERCLEPLRDIRTPAECRWVMVGGQVEVGGGEGGDPMGTLRTP